MIAKRTSHLFTMVAAASLSFTASIAQHEEKTDFGQALTGRWDLTVTVQGKESPAWIEIHKSGANRLVGYFVGSGGSAICYPERIFIIYHNSFIANSNTRLDVVIIGKLCCLRIEREHGEKNRSVK